MGVIYLDFKRRVYLINIYKVINTIYKLCRMDKNLHKYRQRMKRSFETIDCSICNEIDEYENDDFAKS